MPSTEYFPVKITDVKYAALDEETAKEVTISYLKSIFNIPDQPTIDKEGNLWAKHLVGNGKGREWDIEEIERKATKIDKLVVPLLVELEKE